MTIRQGNSMQMVLMMVTMMVQMMQMVNMMFMTIHEHHSHFRSYGGTRAPHFYYVRAKLG